MEWLNAFDLRRMLLEALPWTLFFILLTITIFRKELSTNHQYRDRSVADKEKRNESSPRKALEELLELSNQGYRFKTILNGIVDFNQGVNLYELRDTFFSSLLEGYNAFEFKTLHKLTRRRERNRDVSLFKRQKSTHKSNGRGLVNCVKRLDNLSDVVLLHVMTYLTYKDISALGSCNLALARDTRSDYIWRKLWLQNFGDMWTQESIVSIRKARNITWNPCSDTMKDKRNSSSRRSPDLARDDWHPRQGWFMFFLEFDACWIDWLLAGFCTEDTCLVGIGGNLYDLTAFLPHHPGSMETLLEMCGGDATDQFVDMGHSSHAVKLSKELMIYSPYSNFKKGEVPSYSGDANASDTSGAGLDFGDIPSLSTPEDGVLSVPVPGQEVVKAPASLLPVPSTTRKSRSQNHLLSGRWPLPINSHKRNLVNAFQQQIKREQRAMERNAYKWNLQCSARRKTAAAKSDAERGSPSQRAREISVGGASHRTISEELDFSRIMSTDGLAAPLFPPNILNTGASGLVKKRDGPCGRSDLPHFGRARAVYDPLKQEYFIWWTCCCTVHVNSV